MIIGVQKGGTTSLFHYLSQHPQVISPENKELHYFSMEENYRLGNSWYHAQFPLPNKFKRGCKAFEATPAYLYYPFCAERIMRYDRNLKLVIVLRDPVDRAYSAWNMFRNFRNDPVHSRLTEERGFAEVVAAEMELIGQGNETDVPLEQSYVRRGLYLEQIERYLQFFPREQLFITENTELKADCERVLTELTTFLELPPRDWSLRTREDFNVGRYKEEAMPDATRRLLVDFYRSHNKRLFEFLGKSYSWLSIAICGLSWQTDAGEFLMCNLIN